ncbi:hypothetical protein K435DRAFT_750477 [Dendrothele bispora CBS 962.96]|uniref:Xylosidase/arabinosidase n=1 Tax=Dendrothele bispora (strain CBS 962.96) TaxID=1314807 RepID=A0A4S8MFT3_DENBC|nr:hypothetical protein K435DRAFT_750477 [Dendrothele bispora CBS 962.96]
MEQGKVIRRANPSTIHDKFLVGYQGWFTCAGDGEPIDPGHHGWLHWFNFPIPDGGRPNTDLWPDVSEYSPSELYPAPGITQKTGEPALLFSSRHPKTVERHFHWMARHGVDGAFLQRFAGQCEHEGLRKQRDEIGDNVRVAAEKEGRVFAIMYDVSGVSPERIADVLKHDWVHLIREKGILDSPNYLRENGKAVIALWGFGFSDRGHSPELVRDIVHYIRNVTPGGAYIVAGTPTHWRKSEDDADPNPGFVDVYLNEYDCISPWMVGRLSTESESDHFAEHVQKQDIELLRKSHEEQGRRKVDYMPVVFPGFSGLNLSEGTWKFNQIPRNGGKLMWQQIFNAKRLGVRTIYGAMWDEYDEGTALIPVVEKTRNLPTTEKYQFLALDCDGHDIPADWYMRICGFASEGLKSERLIHETFPSKELQDFWANRPKYEQHVPNTGGSGCEGQNTGDGSGSGGQSYQEWLTGQGESKDELPPPPYSLEDEAPQATQAAQTAAAPSNERPFQAQDADSSHAAGSTDPNVSAIADDLARQSISNSSPSPSPSPSPTPVPDAGQGPTRPPPLHPSHPSLVVSSRPSLPPPSHPSRPSLASRPSSSASSSSGSRPGMSRPGSSVSNTPPPIPTAPRPTGTPQPQTTSSSQWPPVDWNVGGNGNPVSTSYPVYQTQHQQQHYQPQHQHHQQYRPPTGPLPPPGGNPHLRTSPHHSPHSSPYASPHHSPAPEAISFPQAQTSPPMAGFPSGPAFPPGPGPGPHYQPPVGYGGGYQSGPDGGGAYPGGPGGFSFPTPAPVPSNPYGDGSGPYNSAYSNYGPEAPGRYGSPGPGSNPPGGSGYNWPQPHQPHQQYSHPGTSSSPAPSNWTAGGPPPSLPQRPASATSQLSHHPSVSSTHSWYPGQQQQQQHQQTSSAPPSSSSTPAPQAGYPNPSNSRPGGLAGTAYGYIDKLPRGKKVLGELEDRVGSLANQGSKIWGKFSK